MIEPVTAGVIAVLSGGSIFVTWVTVKAWPVIRRLNRFMDDVAGTPARPGVPASPGLMERVASLEDDVRIVKGEVKNSHRSNLREDLDGVAAGVRELHQRWGTSPRKET